MPYLAEFAKKAKAAGLRVDVDASSDRMQKKIRNAQKAKVPFMVIAGDEDMAAGAVSFRYRDGSGEIGVIASVSQPFCGACTRARLSIEGRLVTCLFATGGVDLRAPLRAGADDDELRARIRGAWSDRRDRYSEERASLHDATGEGAARRRIEMYQIGG